MKQRLYIGFALWAVLTALLFQVVEERHKIDEPDTITRTAYDSIVKTLEGERDIEKTLRIHYQMQVRAYELINGKK